jgi:hypothetical protein
LPASQAELLDGVHLPDLVRLLRRRCRRGGLASGRGGGLAEPLHPALQGPGAGRRQVGMQVPQLEQQVRGTPGGMLLMQEQGLLDGLGRRGRRRCRVSRWEGGATLLPESVAQVANRSRR